MKAGASAWNQDARILARHRKMRLGPESGGMRASRNRQERVLAQGLGMRLPTQEALDLDPRRRLAGSGGNGSPASSARKRSSARDSQP